MNYQEFQEQIEFSGLSDWKYYDNESEFSYFRAIRNNDQYQIIYSESEYRYDWNARRRDETMSVEKDCFSLQEAIEFLNMPIDTTDRNRRDRKGVETISVIGILLIGMAIGWISAMATVRIPSNYLNPSTVERI